MQSHVVLVSLLLKVARCIDFFKGCIFFFRIYLLGRLVYLQREALSSWVKVLWHVNVHRCYCEWLMRCGSQSGNLPPENVASCLSFLSNVFSGFFLGVFHRGVFHCWRSQAKASTDTSKVLEARLWVKHGISGIVHLPSLYLASRKGHRELGHAAQAVRVVGRPSLPGHSGDCVSRQRNSTSCQVSTCIS